MTKRLLSVLLVICTVFSLTALAATSFAEEVLPFKDVKTKHWYYDEVKAVYERGLMEGKDATTFAPLEVMTRAQIVTIFYRLAGITETGLGSTLTFTDTKAKAWYADYLGWAVREQLVTGYPEGTFRPNAAVSRQELAKLIVVFLEYMNVTVEGESLIESFADAAKFPSWSKDYIESLRKTGLVGGDTNGNFNHKANANRAEVATIFSRFPEMNAGPEGFIADPSKYLEMDENGRPVFTFGLINAVGVDVAREIFSAKIIEAAGLDSAEYSVVFDNDAQLFTYFPGNDYIQCDHGATAVFNAVPVKFAFKNIASGETTEYVEFAEVVLKKDMSFDVNNALPDDGYTFLFNDVMGDEATFKHWIKTKVRTSHDDVVIDDFAAISAAAASKGTATFKATFTVTGAEPAITTERTYTVDFAKEGVVNNEKDPTPTNVGTVYEDAATGLKISQAIAIDVAYATGTGNHGWHESRVVRTTNGTYVGFISDEKDHDVTYYYDIYESSFTWDAFSLIKITSEGCKVILDDIWFPHANGSCTVNLNQLKNGNVLLTIIAEDKEKYFESWNQEAYEQGLLGFEKEGAWLRVYEIDPATDTFVNPDEEVYKPDFKKAGLHGYGYSQPVVDEENGMLYCMYNSGEVPGYWTWYSYDLNKHEWVGGPYLVEIESRCGYMNVYPDGNGGVFFVAQRHPPRDQLEALLGVTFKAGGYGFDTTYLFAIPDMTKEECILVDRTYEPEYAKGEEVSTASSTHYGAGTTYLDSNGRLHVLNTVTNPNIDRKARIYHTIYDVRDNYRKIKSEQIQFTDKKNNSYMLGMAENTNGDLFIIAINSYMTKKVVEVEIHQSADGGLTFKKVCEPQVVTVQGTGANFTPYRHAFAGSRNHSTMDNVVAIVTSNEAPKSSGGDTQYFYYTIELPH